MNTDIITKLKINKPTHEVYEAIVDPEKMSNYWFSSGSNRLEQGKKIIWKYDEYNAEVTINVLELEDNKKIVFAWGATTVTITLVEHDQIGSTLIEVNESGLNENDPELMYRMLDQKEGWVYMLTCLKGYLENGISNLRASLVK